MKPEEKKIDILLTEEKQNNGLVELTKDEEKQKIDIVELNKDEENHLLSCSKKTIDSILNEKGITGYHISMILICAFIISCDSISVSLIFILNSIASDRFKISKFQIIISNSIIFLGVFISSSFNGKFALNFTRKAMIISSLAILYISNMISAWLSNIWLFSMFKFIDGICVGLLISNAPVIMCEILPSQYRFLILTSIYTSYSLGMIYTYLMFYIFFPNIMNTDYSLGIVSVTQIYLIPLILSFIYLDESPRYLIFMGETDQAFDILKKRFRIDNLTLEDKRNIIQDITGNNNNGETGLSQIFSKKYLFLTVLLLFLNISNLVIATGINSILPTTLKEIDELYLIVKTKKTNKVMLAQAIITNVLQIPNNILAAFLGETELFGRKYTMILGYSLSIIFLIFSLIWSLSFYLLIGFSLFSLGISFSSCSSYTCEVYPTALRANTVGFMNGLGRLMALLSIFIYYGLETINILSPYYFSLINLVVSLICALILPYETRGKDLDLF